MSRTDITALIAEVRRLDTHPHAWKPPWVARRFEIDCPCPNGNHCGDTHTCDEVEAPEDGQCVVQITVPGLETFAAPTAELIAHYRTAAPALADEVERLAAENARLREALQNIALQDLDENGAPAPVEHWANYCDAGSLAGALVFCATKARAALEKP